MKKKNQNKYYAPTIEEFHVGFEYELLDTVSNEWNSQVYGDLGAKDLITRNNKFVCNLDYIEYLTATIARNPHLIRVKYIDKEDIESLGFKFESVYGDFLNFTNGNLITLKCSRSMEIYTPEETIELDKVSVLIENNRDECYFEGYIKNKSELKKVLEMLGIL